MEHAMKLNTVMFAAAVGLASTALADGDKRQGEGTRAEMEQPAEKAQKHAEKAEKEADKAARAAERATEQQTEASAEEQASEQEMEALMAEEIERRVSAAEQAPEKRVFGKVLGVSQEQIVLDIGGAALPVTVNRDTKIDGQSIPRERPIQSHIRAEFQPGQLVSVTYDLKTPAQQRQPETRQPMTQQPSQQPPSRPMPETEPMPEAEQPRQGNDVIY
jgi:hypothetical protein